LNTWAEEKENNQNELNWSFNKQNLSNANYDKLQKLNDNNHPHIEYKMNKENTTYLDKIWVPEIYRGILKANSLIKNLETGIVTSTAKDINVVYKAKSRIAQWAQIYSTNKKIKYETKINNLIKIEDDLNLAEKPNAFIESPPITKAMKLDTNLTLNNAISCRMETFTSTYFNKTFNQIFKINATSVDFKSFYSSDFPLDFGMSFGVQNGSLEGEDFLLKLKSYYLGPEVRWMAKKFKYGFWHIGTGIQQSISFKIHSPEKSYAFSNVVFQLNTSFSFPLTKGDLLIGANFNRFSISTEEEIDDTYLMNKSEMNHFESYGIFIGYNLPINL